MSNYPFHFSFLVKDLDSTRKFYRDILNCTEGRSTDTWVDFDFYGNQLSCHTHNVIPESIECGVVDSVIVPMPHFGCILPWEDFHSLAHRVSENNIDFVIRPHIRFAGEDSEQATMFFKDFSGNSLEFKTFRNPEHIFTRQSY